VDFQPHRIPSRTKLNFVSFFIKTNIISQIGKHIHLLVLLSTGIYCNCKVIFIMHILETIPFPLNDYAHESIPN